MSATAPLATRTSDTKRAWPAKPRLVFCDVDGTLVTRDKRLTPHVRDAVRNLEARGIAFTLASARPPFGLRHVSDPLGITLPISSFNGGVIRQEGHPALAEHFIPQDVAREAIETFTAQGLEIWAFSETQWLCMQGAGVYMSKEVVTVQQQPTVVDSFDAHLATLGKIVAVSDDFAHLAKCERETATQLAGRAAVARSQEYYLDVTHCDATKDRALRTLARHCGIDVADVVAIGDGHNDIAMLRAAGFGIAMGNGSDTVRAAADFVTASNEDDGVAVAIRHLLAHLDAAVEQ